ncbi:MAG: hypothetical protein D6797_07850 [Bdellovibrio sp.]|nr:MAG: hypothetical protein D6797_07850 [Bdellovibrio sp.]
MLSYLWSDKIIQYFTEKSEETRQEVINLLDRMLVSADKNRIAAILILSSAGLGVVTFLILWPQIILGLLMGSIVTILGWRIPKMFLQHLWEKRCSRVVNQMVDGLTIMANGVKAGLSITQSMERVLANMSGPFAQEINLVLNKVRLGMTIEDALIEFGERIPRPDVQMFVSTVNILKETGGNLAETFETIVSTIRERQKIEKKIEALTAQGVMQGIIITLVPFIILILFLLVDASFVTPLFTTPIGLISLALMLTMQIIGGIVMKKIVTIKV